MRISDRSSDVCSSDLPRLQGQGSRSGARVHALFLESRPRDDKRRHLMPQGIKDRVAILGMGCSRFGERWGASAEDLMVEAYHEALADAQIAPEQIDAAWFSTHMDDVGVGRGGTPMGIALRQIGRAHV